MGRVRILYLGGAVESLLVPIFTQSRIRFLERFLKMKKWLLVNALTACYLSGFASMDFVQLSSTAHAAEDGGKMQSTRADFKEFCKAMEGRWIGEVIFVTDWPGLSKKGDKVTGYTDFRISHNGNVLEGRFNAGPGSGAGLFHYDAGKKQIQGRWVSSGGSVWNQVIYIRRTVSGTSMRPGVSLMEDPLKCRPSVTFPTVVRHIDGPEASRLVGRIKILCEMFGAVSVTDPLM